MAVELPEPLQWVLLLLAGTRWPEADEGQLRDMADHWRKAATSLQDAAHAADAAVKQALDGQQGAAADALAKHWADYSVGKGTDADPGYLPGTIAACNGMGDMLEGMANSAETAKIQIIAQLGILAFELATAEAEAPFTAGASMAEIPVFVTITREAVQQFLKKLLMEALEHAVKQAVQMAAINLLAQTIELAQGHRKSIDMKELGQNALGGAVAGATGNLLGKGVGAAGAKMGLEGAMGSTVGKMVTGAGVGVGTDAATQLITTGHVDSNSLLGSGLSGAGGAGLHAGAAAAKSHFNEAPKMAPPHEGLPGAGAGGDHNAPVTFSPSTSTDHAAGTPNDTYHGPGTAPAGESGATPTPTGTTGLSVFGSNRPAESGRPSSSPEPSLAASHPTAPDSLGRPADNGTPSPTHETPSTVGNHDTTQAPDPSMSRGMPPRGGEALRPVAEAVPAHEVPTTPQGEALRPVAEAAPAHEVPLREGEAAAPVHEVPTRQGEALRPVAEATPVHEVPTRQGEMLTPTAEAAPVHEQQQSAAAPAHETGSHDPQPQPQPVVPESRPAPPSSAAFAESGAPAPASHVSPDTAPAGEHLGGATPLPDAHLSGVGTTHLDGTRLASGPVPTRSAAGERPVENAADQVPVPPSGADAPPTAAPMNGAPPMMSAPHSTGPHSGPHATDRPSPRQEAAPPPRPDGSGSSTGKGSGTGPGKGSGSGTGPGNGAGSGPGRAGDQTGAGRFHTQEQLQRQQEREAQQHAFNTREHGTETPIEPARDVPRMSQQERLRALGDLKPEERRQLAKDPAFVEELRKSLTPDQFAETAAHLIVHVDPRTEQAGAARHEAQQQAARLLRDPETAARLLKGGAELVVIPRDVRMTDVPGFEYLRGTDAGGDSGLGRGWDDIRGSGGLKAGITEDNLLGEHTTIGSGGSYKDGYSTTTHELAHTVHQHGLAPKDKELITKAFNDKKNSDGSRTVQWVDGPRRHTDGRNVDNYSSTNELEYFAQVSNAYLSTNHGVDPETGHPRNNGAHWVRQNEPALLPLLERLYGTDPLSTHTGGRANPVDSTQAHAGVGEFFAMAENQAHPTPTPAPAHAEPPTRPAPEPPHATPPPSPTHSDPFSDSHALTHEDPFASPPASPTHSDPFSDSHAVTHEGAFADPAHEQPAPPPRQEHQTVDPEKKALTDTGMDTPDKVMQRLTDRLGPVDQANLDRTHALLNDGGAHSFNEIVGSYLGHEIPADHTGGLVWAVQHGASPETVKYLFGTGEMGPNVVKDIGTHPDWVNPKELGKWLVGIPQGGKKDTLLGLNEMGLGGGEKLLYLGAGGDIEHPLMATGAKDLTFVSTTPASEMAGLRNTVKENLQKLAGPGYEVHLPPQDAPVEHYSVTDAHGNSVFDLHMHHQDYDAYLAEHPGQFDYVMDKDSWLKDWKGDTGSLVEAIGPLVKKDGYWIGGTTASAADAPHHEGQPGSPFGKVPTKDPSMPWSGYQSLHVRQRTEASPQEFADHLRNTPDGGWSSMSGLIDFIGQDHKLPGDAFLDKVKEFGEYADYLPDEQKNSAALANHLADWVGPRVDHAPDPEAIRRVLDGQSETFQAPDHLTEQPPPPPPAPSARPTEQVNQPAPPPPPSPTHSDPFSDSHALTHEDPFATPPLSPTHSDPFSDSHAVPHEDPLAGPPSPTHTDSATNLEHLSAENQVPPADPVTSNGSQGTPGSPTPTPTPTPHDEAPTNVPRPAATLGTSGTPGTSGAGLHLGPVRPPGGTGHGATTAGGPVHADPAERFQQAQRDQRQAELDALKQKSLVEQAVEARPEQRRFLRSKPDNADHLVRDIPGMAPHERVQTLDSLNPEHRRWLAQDPAFVDSLRNSLSPKEFAQTAAHLMVDVDPRTEQAASARRQAQLQAERMLQNPDVAARLLKANAGMVVVPRDRQQTEVGPFTNLRGKTAGGASGGGRPWDEVRGSGGRRAGVTEDNLLGEPTTVKGADKYADGYSTTTHEFAHTLHEYGLSPADKKLITDTYTGKLKDASAAWPDGPRQDAHGNPVDNYASKDEKEYFAQVTNTYLGTNHGTDPYTGLPRNNGPEWVRTNEPGLAPLMERLYGPDPTPLPANPVKETAFHNDMYEGYRDFMTGVDETGRVQQPADALGHGQAPTGATPAHTASTAPAHTQTTPPPPPPPAPRSTDRSVTHDVPPPPPPPAPNQHHDAGGDHSDVEMGDAHSDHGGSRPMDGVEHQLAPVTANQAFHDLVGTLDHAGPLTEHDYRDFVAKSLDEKRKLSFVVNSMVSHSDLGRIDEVIGSITSGMKDPNGRIGVVIGVNGQEHERAQIDQAIAEAQARLQGQGVPVAFVPSTFKGPFPYGTMRNDVLHSDATQQLVHGMMANGSHPYISVQDFDTGSRLVPSGSHVFDHFESSLNVEPPKPDTPLKDQLPPSRPLAFVGGYRLPTHPDEISTLIEDTKRRYTDKGDPLPAVLADPARHQEYLDQLAEQLHRDMSAREWQSQIHPLLPYGPEPNLFVDGAAAIFHGAGGGPQLSFGKKGAEFTQLGVELNRLNARELLGDHGGQSGQSGPQDLERFRVDASNYRLPVRGEAFRTDFHEGAIVTDLSRLGRTLIDTNSMGQSHANLTTVAGRMFSADGTSNPRGAKKGVELGPYRKKLNPADEATYQQQEPYRPRYAGEDPHDQLPKKVADVLGNKKVNVLSDAISAPGHEDVQVGIQEQHKVLVAQALARTDPRLRLGGLLAYVKFEQPGLPEPRPEPVVLTGGDVPMPHAHDEQPVIPADGDCLYHAVNALQGHGVDTQSALELRNRVVDWALQPQNLVTVTDYAMQHGVDINELFRTVALTGNWNSDAGDLVPRMVAGALGVPLIIHTGGVQHEMPPLGGGGNPGGQPIHLFLEDNHYTPFQEDAAAAARRKRERSETPDAELADAARKRLHIEQP